MSTLSQRLIDAAAVVADYRQKGGTTLTHDIYAALLQASEEIRRQEQHDDFVERFARDLWETNELMVRGDGQHGDWAVHAQKSLWRVRARLLIDRGYKTKAVAQLYPEDPA